MITNILLTIITQFVGLIIFVLPKWNLWPQALVNGINYFSSALVKFNFIFPIDTLFDILKFLPNFFIVYFVVRLVLMIFNYARGTGKGLDL